MKLLTIGCVFLAISLAQGALAETPGKVKETTIIKEVITTKDQFGNVINERVITREVDNSPEAKAKAAALLEKQKQLISGIWAKKAAKKPVPKWPTRLDQHYMVSSKGKVTKLVGENDLYKLYVERATKLSKDLGRNKGAKVALATYNLKTGRMKQWQKLIFPPELQSKYRHCGEIYGWPDEYVIKNAKKRDGRVLDGVWEISSVSAKGFCEVPLTNRSTCKVVGCSKYYGKRVKGLLMTNRIQAVEVGRVKELKNKNPETYEQMMAKARTRHGSSRNNEPSKGYFDRGGACGALSCDEADTNQFIIDNYW